MKKRAFASSNRSSPQSRRVKARGWGATDNETNQPLTILLADDEPSLRAAVAEYLRGTGYRVLESQSAHDAVELARTHSASIDVLL